MWADSVVHRQHVYNSCTLLENTSVWNKSYYKPKLLTVITIYQSLLNAAGDDFP